MHQAPVTTVKLKFCIVNCYPKASRKNFDLSDFGHPHDTAVRFRGITRGVTDRKRASQKLLLPDQTISSWQTPLAVMNLELARSIIPFFSVSLIESATTGGSVVSISLLIKLKSNGLQALSTRKTKRSMARFFLVHYGFFHAA